MSTTTTSMTTFGVSAELIQLDEKQIEARKAVTEAKKAVTEAKRAATLAAKKLKEEADGINEMTKEEKKNYRISEKAAKEAAKEAAKLAAKLAKDEEKAAKEAAKLAAKLAKDEEKAALKAAQPILFHAVAGAPAPVNETTSWKDVVSKMAVPFKKNLMRHHEIYSLPVKGEYVEELLSKALTEAGFSTDWKPDFSHKVGEDMSLVGVTGGRISCKSGAKTETSVKINGSRSESFKELEGKINHFSSDHDDVCFMLSKTKPFNKVYTLLVYRSAVIKPNLLTWRESVSGKAWEGDGDFSATIGKSMSSQLWTTLPLNMAEVTYVFDCREPLATGGN
jgi:hypothetical protein